MKPQLSDEKIDICDELSELGFPSMANSLEYENPEIEEKQYYLADLDRAAAENTEEELPESVYFQAKSLLDQFFEMPNEDQIIRMAESKLRSIIQKVIKESGYEGRYFDRHGTLQYRPDEQFDEELRFILDNSPSESEYWQQAYKLIEVLDDDERYHAEAIAEEKWARWSNPSYDYRR